MSNKGNKKSEQPENVASASQVESGAAEAAQAETAAADEIQSSDENPVPEKEKLEVVVCHYPGTMEIMEKIWKKNTDSERVHITMLQVDKEWSFEGQLVQAMILGFSRFVLCPANVFPTRFVSLETLTLPTVYVDRSGLGVCNSGLPVLIDADQALASIEAVSAFEGSERQENLARAILYSRGEDPVQVGHSFGNFVAKVQRGTPCMNRFIEALMYKKFIVANAVGFGAVTGELKARFK